MYVPAAVIQIFSAPTNSVFQNSLLRLALECFACIMRYMGDLPLLKNQLEVDCVNTLLMYCHKFDVIRDEVYCQIMKQTTNNKSATKVSQTLQIRSHSIALHKVLNRITMNNLFHIICCNIAL